MEMPTQTGGQSWEAFLSVVPLDLHYFGCTLIICNFVESTVDVHTKYRVTYLNRVKTKLTS